MANIRYRAEIDKDDHDELWWQAYVRVMGASAVLTSIRKTIEIEDAEIVLGGTEKDAHEALARLGERAASESVDMLYGLLNAAELWETRARECGWKAEDAPAASDAGEHAEDESDRDREQKALVELALLDSTPTEAIKKARVKLHMLCLKAKDEK